MIAEKLDVTQQESGGDTEVLDIFAGLSFPQAPTSFVRPSSSTNDHMNEDMIELQSTDTYATTQDLIELEPFAETDNFPVFPSAPTHTPTMESNLIETSSPPLYSAPTQQQPSAQVMSGISISVPPPSQTQSALSAQHFDSLYGHGEETVSSPKDNSGQSLYPSLQTLLAISNGSEMNGVTQTDCSDTAVKISPSYSHNPAYNVNYVEDVEEEVEGTEQTPFIQQQQHHVPLQPHVHTRTQQPLSQETLLKRENERLQNELRALQASMGSVQQAQVEESRLSSPVVVSSGARTGPYSASSTAAPTQQSVLQTRPMSIHDIQQRQLQIQQQLQNNRTQTQTQTNQPQPQTQQQLSTSTSNEQATLKYVCCGSCRQWLSSPRDAAFVYCPGCGAVNNCNIRPTDASTTSSAPPVHAAPPARRVGERWPWYLQCVENLF